MSLYAGRLSFKAQICVYSLCVFALKMKVAQKIGDGDDSEAFSRLFYQEREGRALATARPAGASSRRTASILGEGGFTALLCVANVCE